MKYLLREYDEQPAKAILCEMWLPPGEIWRSGGYLFVPPDLARRLGTPDEEVTFGETKFPAWSMGGEMPK